MTVTRKRLHQPGIAPAPKHDRPGRAALGSRACSTPRPPQLPLMPFVPSATRRRKTSSPILRRRIAATRCRSGTVAESPGECGSRHGKLGVLAKSHDWRKVEARVNALPQSSLK